MDHNSTPLLEMKGVEKRFGGVRAIDHFDLQVMPRDIYGLIGPNGAGKTTIFNTITGIYRADEGQILFEGKDITKIKPHDAAALGIARTFQNIRLFGNLSVKMNVIIACNMHNRYTMAEALLRLPRYRKVTKAVEERAMNFLESVGLTDKADDIASSLPYGHQRKLEIARAMATDPKLLLLDEPAAGMNEEESLELVEFLKKLHRDNPITILMIEHHMDVVSRLCGQCTVLDFGRTLAQGTVEEVKQNESVVAAYLGGEL
ncbi:MAG: ABC transporter ATP-binding protein [Anaerolineaceae bacterium]|nr:ABC transporter ATP-binding protein [Anaerolineaceae bacterium]